VTDLKSGHIRAELPPMDIKMKSARMLNRTLQLLGTFATSLSLIVGVGLSAGEALAQSADFSAFQVEYAVGNNHINAGSAVLQLQQNGDEWTYSLRTKPTGVFKLTGKGKIQETSVFNVSSSSDELELKPVRYSYRQDNEARRSVDAWFNWDAKQLTYNRRGEEVTEPLEEQLLDRLSVTLMVIDALKRDNFEQAKLNVFDNGRIKTMLFDNEGTETVKTRMGNLKTIRVRSSAEGGGTRYTTTWFAPELDYVPVKIEQFKREKLVARLKLTTLRNRVTESGGAKAYTQK